jgi:3-oxoacyl-[acyl-carrier protein] reductase
VTDRYQALANSPLGRRAVKAIGLPTPVPLERHEPGRPVVSAPVLVGTARGGRVVEPVMDVLRSIGARARTEAASEDGEPKLAAIVFDATGIDDSLRLRTLYDFFHPVVRSLARSGRLLVIGTPPEVCPEPRMATAQRAIEGFVRSVAKELRDGSTAQLVYVTEGAENAIESTLRFLLSARSAYVSGQVIRIEPVEPDDVVAPEDWDRPLAGRASVVTGCARGIGEAIAETFARDGAEVVCVDIPAQGGDLTEVANRIGGTAVQLDITDPDAPAELARHLTERHGGVDVMVHNAGVTRDKTLAGMDDEQWDSVLDINLSSQERINDALLAADVLRRGGRIVSVSSVGGIAGNRGQTNYATSKAGIIGMVNALAPTMRERHATINAVAPGFIETQMTAAMPVTVREAGRRMNSLGQGGLPVDVAETIGWLASPGSAGVNGNVVRVCGQALLGA